MLTRNEINVINSKLMGYYAVKDETAERENDIIFAGDRSIDGMPRGSGVSNSTMEKGIRLAGSAVEMERWIVAIDEVLVYYRGCRGHLLKVFEMKYRHKKHPMKIMIDMNIEKTTYYRWINEILMDVALKLASKGVMKF